MSVTLVRLNVTAWPYYMKAARKRNCAGVGRPAATTRKRAGAWPPWHPAKPVGTERPLPLWVEGGSGRSRRMIPRKEGDNRRNWPRWRLTCRSGARPRRVSRSMAANRLTWPATASTDQRTLQRRIHPGERSGVWQALAMPVVHRRVSRSAGPFLMLGWPPYAFCSADSSPLLASNSLGRPCIHGYWPLTQRRPPRPATKFVEGALYA
jgi:hypothetical protein